MNMQAEKERIIQIINKMPEEKLWAVIEAVDEIDLNFDPEDDFDPKGPESVMIRNKEDLYRAVQEGLEDVKAGRVYTLEEARAIMETH